MAAEAALSAGVRDIHIVDRMPSVGRKFLMAGKSGLNLTNAESLDRLVGRFGDSETALAPMLRCFGPDPIRDWARGLGVETFVGSSGRVFPVDLKAAPLLRAWVRRLKEGGARFHMRHRWLGWDDAGHPIFAGPDRMVATRSAALILALGGASWPQLGSDGGWVALLQAAGVAVAPLAPANCGFDVRWSAHFRERFAGHPVKPAGLSSDAGATRGEFVITKSGIEGGGVYPHSAALRDRIRAEGAAVLTLDLFPDRSVTDLAAALGRPRGARTVAEHLRRAGIVGVKAGLLRETLPPDRLTDWDSLARAAKSLPLRLAAPRPIAEAISSAGGVVWAEIDPNLMLRRLPGTYVAGEMLDWEAATGGYLLTACLATGRHAGLAAARAASQSLESTAVG
jgi:uncharacterized flavoprotein (TIGR03862 family)